MTIIIATLKRGGGGTAPFPTTKQEDARLAHVSVADLSERDTLEEWRRISKMTCFVIGENKTYRLGTDITIAGQLWTDEGSAGNFQTVDEKNQPDGYVGLNSQGWVDPQYIRSIWVQDYFTADDEAARFLLVAKTGDIVHQLDNNFIYIKKNNNTPPTVAGDWADITTAATITSVNGLIGAVQIDFDTLLSFGSSAAQFETAVDNSTAIGQLTGQISNNNVDIATLFALVNGIINDDSSVIPLWDVVKADYIIGNNVIYDDGGTNKNLYRCKAVPAAGVAPSDTNFWELVGDFYTQQEMDNVLGNKADLVGGLVPIAQLPPSVFGTITVVPDLAARDAILVGDRFEFMQVGVSDIGGGTEGLFYLADPLTNSDWVLLEAGDFVLTDGSGTKANGTAVDLGGVLTLTATIRKDNNIVFEILKQASGDDGEYQQFIMSNTELRQHYHSDSADLDIQIGMEKAGGGVQAGGGLYINVAPSGAATVSGMNFGKTGIIIIGDITGSGRASHLQYDSDYSAKIDLLAPAVKELVIPHIKWILANSDNPLTFGAGLTRSVDTIKLGDLDFSNDILLESANSSRFQIISEQFGVQTTFLTDPLEGGWFLEMLEGTEQNTISSGTQNVDIIVSDIVNYVTNLITNPNGVELVIGPQPLGGFYYTADYSNKWGTINTSNLYIPHLGWVITNFLRQFGTGSIKTLSGGVAASGDNRNLVIAAETSTIDDMIELTGLTVGDKVLLRADTGDTITVKHNAGGATIKILLQDDSDFVLDEVHPLELILTDTNELVQVGDDPTKLSKTLTADQDVASNVSFSKQVKGGAATVAFLATKVFSMDNGTFQKMPVTATITSLAISDEVNGSSYWIVLEIGGSGSYDIPQAGVSFGTRTDNSVDDSAADWWPTTVGSKIIYTIGVEPDGDTFYTIETITV